MSKDRKKKLIYLNITMLIVFIIGVLITLIDIFHHRIEDHIVGIAYMCVGSATTFWTAETHWIFKGGKDESTKN